MKLSDLIHNKLYYVELDDAIINKSYCGFAFFVKLERGALYMKPTFGLPKRYFAGENNKYALVYLIEVKREATEIEALLYA